VTAPVTDRGMALAATWLDVQGVRGREDAVTWCALRITVSGRVVTIVDNSRDGSVEQELRTSAYPLAEWIAQHWWSLQFDLRPAVMSPELWTWSRVRDQRWLRSHNMRAAGNGLPWPDLTVLPEGDLVRLVWRDADGEAGQPLTFLTSGDQHVIREDLVTALRQFVEQVIARLREHEVTGTPLQLEWDLITSSDADEVAFASAAARLGRTPTTWTKGCPRSSSASTKSWRTAPCSLNSAMPPTRAISTPPADGCVAHGGSWCGDRHPAWTSRRSG